MPDRLEPLDPETALTLLRSRTWHPDTVAACLRHVDDWLSDTGQHGAAGELRGIWVTAPDGTPMTVAELIGAEYRIARRLERASENAESDAELEPWRAPYAASS